MWQVGQGICKAACNERTGRGVSLNHHYHSVEATYIIPHLPVDIPATLSIVKMTSFNTVHPGINFLIKNVGAIFRKLFQV